jgi:SAM-dependent methyltransferase
MNGSTQGDVGPDASNGYEDIAQRFLERRSQTRVGAGVIRAWAQGLPRSGTVLDLGCGSGEPVARILDVSGLRVWGVDASPTLVAAFRRHLPRGKVVCEPVEHSNFFGRRFDGIVAIGLMFLLTEAAQRALIPRIARALAPCGELLFTAPEQACSWQDVLTGRISRSLGAETYRAALAEAGLKLLPSMVDEGGNHHYRARSTA